MATAQMMKRAMKEARRILSLSGDSFTDEDVADYAADEIIPEMEEERAEYIEMFGAPEDTPCIESADVWGTGEGRFHGVI